MFLQKTESFHHPRVEAAPRVFRNLANHVQPILQPTQFATRRRGKDRRLAILAPVSVLRYLFATVSVTSWSVV